MSTVDEYHQFARDCLRWAARGRTEDQRKQFLTLANDWTQAALLIEGEPGQPPDKCVPLAQTPEVKKMADHEGPDEVPHRIVLGDDALGRSN